MSLTARKAIALAILASLVLSACQGLPQTENPIPGLGPASPDTSKTLIVMLPGRGDRAETFLAEDFVAIAVEHSFETLAVDAHLGYYFERSLLPRLRDDIIHPAREKGYENIWLLGISMGGFGSLLYAQAHPEDVDGLILLAPWLGGEEIIADIRSAGSLTAWRPDGKGFPAHETSVWRWLQDETAKPNGKPIILGYGLSDRLAGGLAPLVDAIPESTVYTRDGEHKWTTWRPLWRSIAADLGPRLSP